ncbi:AP-5 complex subunit sigma-1 [Nematostella vectensis]|uniref:AP-5 complex subunit sigma-1 n=1 Tax=Nematostella vectensis TaxID=45351 RepID=UPI002077188C|nr:AP-5 complex subunit sigma-1 [Nematostella vectensis]
MVYAFIVHTLNPGPCRVLFSTSFIQDLDVDDTEDPRTTRKENLQLVAQRMQSEYAFTQVASGVILREDLSGMSTTEEILAQLESGIFRLQAGNPFSTDKVVVWKGTGNCGFCLVCEPTENRIIAENVLILLIRFIQEYCRVIPQTAEAILKADKLAAVTHQFLPNGQLLFMNHRFVRQMEKELEQVMAMK